MIGISADKVGGGGDNAVAINAIVAINITREDGNIRRPVAFVAARLCAAKAAIECETARELKGAIDIIVTLAGAFVGVVDTGSHPNFTGCADGQRILEIGKGVRPVAAISIAGATGLDIKHTHRWTSDRRQ